MIISNTEQDKFTHLKNTTKWGRLMAQPVKRPTLAQVTVSHFVEFERRVGLYADSSEPAWDSLSPSPTCTLFLSLTSK